MFQLGIDRILETGSSNKLISELGARRVALLAHPASMTSDFRHSMDALISDPRFKVTAAFGPQHGMHGEKQDNMMETDDYIDPVYKIPVYSLYGEVRRPTAQMMAQFDILLVDVQDVGCRIYTFLTTLLYVMEEAAKYKKAVWVLDRPNPAGRPVEGTLLKPGWVSFVGAAEGIPMRHGLTLGEAALWFKKNLKIDVELKVVAMVDYAPDQGMGFGWPVNELSWVNPSPNASTLSMARCYPGTVLIEGTTLSEGRGTTRPLETLGGPGFDMVQVLKAMHSLAPEWLKGCRLRPCNFLPTFHKHAGQIIAGFQIHVDDRHYDHQQFRPYRLVALWLKAIRLQVPDYPIWKDFHYEYEKDRLAFDLINGGSSLREWIDDKAALPKDFENTATQDELSWLDTRREFMLY